MVSATHIYIYKTRAKRTLLLRQNFVMPRLCYGSAEQVNLLCSHLNRKVQFSPFSLISREAHHTFQFSPFTFHFKRLCLFTLAHSVASGLVSPTRTPPSRLHRQTRTMGFGRLVCGVRPFGLYSCCSRRWR